MSKPILFILYHLCRAGAQRLPRHLTRWIRAREDQPFAGMVAAVSCLLPRGGGGERRDLAPYPRTGGLSL